MACEGIQHALHPSPSAPEVDGAPGVNRRHRQRVAWAGQGAGGKRGNGSRVSAVRQQSAKLTRGPMAEKSQYLRAPSRVSVDKIAWLHQNSRAARLSISGSLHALPGLER